MDKVMSGSKFKAGDVCEIMQTPNMPIDQLRFVGEEVVLLKPCDCGFCTRSWLISPPLGYYTVAHEQVLKLKRPPAEYDGGQAGSWNLCPWKPAKELAR